MQKGARVRDRLALVLSALAVGTILFVFIGAFDRFRLFAYSLCLSVLVVWPPVALWAVRRGGAVTVVYAYGTYILLLAYVVGHIVPYAAASRWLSRAGHTTLGLGALSVFCGWMSEVWKPRRRAEG